MKIGSIYETKILRLNNEGEGVGIVEGITTFIPYTNIDEIVKVKIESIYDNYARGNIVQNKKDVLCSYFYECGGCNIMHLDFDKQLIESIFKKISNENIKVDNIYSYKQFNYRNKAVFKVDKDKIGFYKEKTNEIVNIDKCLLMDDKINEVLIDIKKFITKYIDNDITEIMIRVINNKIMISLDNINLNYKSLFIEKFNYSDSNYINNRLEYGEKV